ncbi:hypothetical protein SCYAM73S_02541 [Streptomyces cyaneofuscatus]
MLYAMEARAYATWASPRTASARSGWPRTPSSTPDSTASPSPTGSSFSEAELNGENAHSYRDLAYVAGRSPTYASLAEPVMEKAVELFGEDDEHQRSYALNLIGMATVHLLQERKPEQSTVLAGQALKIAKKDPLRARQHPAAQDRRHRCQDFERCRRRSPGSPTC